MGLAFSFLPNPIADCRESGYYILSTCSDQFCWDVVDSSRLPFLQIMYCNPNFSAKLGLRYKSFTSWYALLLLFFLRFSAISPHCSPIQFSLAFFMHILLLLFTSLYFSDPSSSIYFSQFSPFVAQIKKLCSDPGFFLLTMFAKDLTGCFSHCCVEGGDH